MSLLKSVFSISLILASLTLSAQAPQSQPLHIPLNIQKTYQKQLRLPNGKPGPNYWQNRSDYRIQVEFDPYQSSIAGAEQIKYTNNSPDTLRSLVFRLYPDIFRKGTIRNEAVQPADLHDGVQIGKMDINGRAVNLSAGGGASRNGTNLVVPLPVPMAPNSSILVNLNWSYPVPRETTIREGRYDSTSYFIAYWYPQIAVYDAVDGWDMLDYIGDQEFYNNFGDFEVEVTVPANFIVWATGTLQNPDQLLSKDYLARYRQAQTSDKVVNIIRQADLAKRNFTTPGAKKTWRFKANWVPDFAFATSDHYLWDATSIVVDPIRQRRVVVDAAYKQSSADFYEVAAIGRNAVDYLSRDLPGIPFPYPQVTIFNGHGGMEFPMMVNDGSTQSRTYTELVTSHEIAHTYFPFYMGINERKYAWMDEGWADVFERSTTPTTPVAATFSRIAGREMEIPPMIPSIQLRGMAYGVASYVRPAMAYTLLRDVMGEEVFRKALREYMGRWNGKHPLPYDFFFTFNDVAGEDLSWFWRPWFFEQGYPDLALQHVSPQAGVVEVTVQRLGNMPVPVSLRYTFTDGTTETHHEKTTIWRDGRKQTIIRKNFTKPLRSVELGNQEIPDVNLENNTWQAR